MTESGYLFHILPFSIACFVLGSINASGRHNELVRTYVLSPKGRYGLRQNALKHFK